MLVHLTGKACFLGQSTKTHRFVFFHTWWLLLLANDPNLDTKKGCFSSSGKKYKLKFKLKPI